MTDPRESIVEIKGGRYRYHYDPNTQKTIYDGPVGSAPEIGEAEFLAEIDRNKKYQDFDEMLRITRERKPYTDKWIDEIGGHSYGDEKEDVVYVNSSIFGLRKVKPEGLYNTVGEGGYVVDSVDNLLMKGNWKTSKYHIVEPFWYYDKDGNEALGSLHFTSFAVSMQLYNPETGESITKPSPVFFQGEFDLAREWMDLEMAFEHDPNIGWGTYLMGLEKFKRRPVGGL